MGSGISSFLLLNKANRLAFIAHHASGARILYPPAKAPAPTPDAAPTPDPATNKTGIKAKTSGQDKRDRAQARKAAFLAESPTAVIANALETLAAEEVVELGSSYTRPSDAKAVETHATGSKLPGALSLAMCSAQRAAATARADGNDMATRVLAVGPHGARQDDYVAMMNCIFSAQRLGVRIDSLVLSAKDSLLLQQAADLTGGLYKAEGKAREDLMQTLVMMYLADDKSRDMLVLPAIRGVDYRASCFCHDKHVDMGWVCPVCLGIFCKDTPNCPVCTTRLPRAVRVRPPTALVVQDRRGVKRPGLGNTATNSHKRARLGGKAEAS